MKTNIPNRKGLPVIFLIEGKACLVVGGGKTALRVITHLLDSGAAVSVVSPEVCPEVNALIAERKITHTAREFEAGDINGAALVFAATNDRSINRQVLSCCREAGILCSCVDGNWSRSDFTLPSIIRHGNLTLSVSTEGRSSRQAKLIKTILAKHIDMVETSDLVVVGTDHRHMTIEEREPFHLTGHRFERTGWMLMQLWGIHEFLILNTCNRIELIAVVSRETSSNGIMRHVLGFDKLKEDKYYLKRGLSAFEHLCLVTAGMLSQTPGEKHIAAQVKNALEIAKRHGWANSIMQEWVSAFLHVSKRIKNEISPLLNNDEIESLAIKYIEAEKKPLQEKTLMVLGAGTVGTGLIKNSFPKVGKIIWCYHVNRPQISNDWKNKVELCTFNAIKDRIGEADIIICATEAPGHVLHHGHAPFFNQEKNISLIDLGMPRNIDPALDDLSPEISVVDLDGLKYWYRRELADMDGILNRCRKLISEHQDLYETIIQRFQIRNTPE